MRCSSERRSAFSLGAGILLSIAVGAARAEEVYLTESEAPAAVFPAANRFERREIAVTPELRARLARRLDGVKTSHWESRYLVVAAFRGGELLGHGVVVEEVGKHRAITFIVGFDRRGKVAGVAVMAYREPYGGEVRSRRFLSQYRGRGPDEPLLPGRDIRNLAGATLSARAIGRGIKKAAAVLEETLGRREAPSVESLTRPPVEVRGVHYVMGTLLEITIEAPDRPTGLEWIQKAVDEARRLDRQLSSFDDDSDLSKLNREVGRGFRPVSPDLFRLLSMSRELSRRSGGAFDVSVGPLMELWRDRANRAEWPKPAALSRARRAVGWRKIHLREPDQVALEAPGMALDLGGIGKGYAADRMGEVLRRLGATKALVNFGESSILAVGPPPGRSAWPIWVRRGNGLVGPIRLRDLALSTSRSLGGSGRRLGHIMDPRRGEPLREDRQGTVVAPTATEAEAWSKALVIEPEATLARVEREGELAGLLLTSGRRTASASFARLAAFGERTR